jgi:hypothetical protein
MVARIVLVTIALALSVWFVVDAQTPLPSMNSTSRNRTTAPATTVPELPWEDLANFRVLAANDLGMHCGDLDHRNASILPPFNTLHAQVIKRGGTPRILDATQAQVTYSATSNPRDPALGNPLPSRVFKTNFWDTNPRTGRLIAFDAYDPHYPPGILGLFPLKRDLGLPVPDLQRLYLGDFQLSADQQAMPSSTAPGVFRPYVANAPQLFKTYYQRFPFFISFPFGYTLTDVSLFSAEGIPVAPFDDNGRYNPYPLMRVQAVAAAGNVQGLAPGTVMSSLDTVTPVSGEMSCKTCHTSAADGGNGLATDGKGFPVATRRDDPQFGRVPLDVSIEYAFDLNILRLHDMKHGTALETETPVSCQSCHYSPALDLAHVGPSDANGRDQMRHHSMSHAIHRFHGTLKKPNGALLFPRMPSPSGRTAYTRELVLDRTCYQCHPGKVTKCFRGAMARAGVACQDCHGELWQVGNDFSRNVSPTTPGQFIVAADYYTNPATPRVPWANEPMCQSCHTGDVNSNLAGSAGVVAAADGIRLLQAYRSTDANAKPIVATNRRFAENTAGAQQVLYRLSQGHGGIFCEGCHGSTHAEWSNPNRAANDNVTPVQLQGFAATLRDCTVCHGTTPFSVSGFTALDANGFMPGPHGMHPLDAAWNHNHHWVYRRVPAGTCQACHGAQLQGSVLARLPVSRTLICDDVSGCQAGRITLPAGTMIGCHQCHEAPGSAAPAIPTARGQRQANGTTPIPLGGTATASTVFFRGTVSDPDHGQTVRLQVEPKRVGTAFTGTVSCQSAWVPAGTATSCAVRGLGFGTGYHWRARAEDSVGRTSAWASYGTNAETAADFVVVSDTLPGAPAGRSQRQANGTTPIPLGGTATAGTVVFHGTVSDPDPGQTVRLQVEVKPLGTAFTGTVSCLSAWVTPGTATSCPTAGLTVGTGYHWRTRAVDSVGGASAWASYGTNAETAADFIVAP